MKNYFQKIYNETGVKPFTFLNCALSVLLPFVLFIAIGSALNPTTPEESIKLFVGSMISLIVCWGLDIVLLYKKFNDGKRTAILFFLGLLASIAFFCKLIIFPLIKLAINLMGSATAVQTGNFASANRQSSRATAEAGGLKLSAFNWFVYDGREVQDIEPTIPDEPITAANNNAWCSELQRSFTDQEDSWARGKGYTDAKNAYDRGVSINDITKGY